jgi:hypothetical protein
MKMSTIKLSYSYLLTGILEEFIKHTDFVDNMLYNNPKNKK